MVWKPHVTVAAVIEKNNQFLLVEEHTSYGLAFNQPAGHLENGESLMTAIKREVLEETAWLFEPRYIVSIQLWRKNSQAESFLRVCFAGDCYQHNPNLALDEGIVATHWLTHQQIIAKKNQLRSSLVLTSIEQYLSGEHYPLNLLKSFIDINP